MKTDIWMPIYIGDYLKDTMHLSTEQHGAYFLMLLDMWNKGGLIPFELKLLSRIVRSNPEQFQTEIWPGIMPYFDVETNGSGKFLKHSRLMHELNESKARRIRAQENGKKGGRPKITQKKPRGLPTGNPTPNPEKTSSPSHIHNSFKGKKEDANRVYRPHEVLKMVETLR